MFVITDLLHAAGNESHRAAEHAQEGADQLSRRPLSSGILGEFPAADAQEVLTAAGRKAHQAATGFTDMDEGNAANLRAVRCNCVT
jgi:Protein of unknown function (DUF2563)